MESPWGAWMPSWGEQVGRRRRGQRAWGNNLQAWRLLLWLRRTEWGNDPWAWPVMGSLVLGQGAGGQQVCEGLRGRWRRDFEEGVMRSLVNGSSGTATES